MDLQIPGPGAAMAIAAAAAVCAAAYVAASLEGPDDFSNIAKLSLAIIMLIAAILFGYLTIRIERIHTTKGSNNKKSRVNKGIINT
ncbi:hypothetical protein KAU55_00660 [Candidatus Bathyarchaeota archaeon]|nr:hypothetical protein [Candidatus Bathyarchaeota archaeon]